MKVHALAAKFYTNAQGRAPCAEWLNSLDRSVRARLGKRIDRLRLGNLGDHATAKRYWQDYLRSKA